MKKSVLVLFLFTSLVMRAEEEMSWFCAGFDGCGENDHSSEGGAWHYYGTGSVEFDAGRMDFDGTECSSPVMFTADSRRDCRENGIVVTCESKMSFNGYEELPLPPALSDGYSTGIVGVDQGNYFVLGFDGEGGTNRWFDTGIEMKSGEEIDVVVVFASSNSVDNATYRIDGESFGPVRIFKSDVSSVDYIGCGIVSRLDAHHHGAPRKVAVVLPSVFGVRAAVNDAMAYPGEIIEVLFFGENLCPSRDKALYIVQEDGTLVFVDIGEEPFGKSAETIFNWNSYWTFEQAVSAARPGDQIQLITDVLLSGDLVYKGGFIDFNGYGINASSPGGARLIITVGSSPEFDLYCGSCGGINIEIVAESDIDFGYNSWLAADLLTIAKPDVVIRSCDRMSNVHCGLAGYEVEESYSQWTYEYRLVKNREPEYPEFLNDTSLEIKTRYNEWASAKGGSRNEVDIDAYLLDCSPAEVESERDKFRIVGMEKTADGWKVRVAGDRGEGERYGNGYVHIRQISPAGVSVDAVLFKAELRLSPVSE